MVSQYSILGDVIDYDLKVEISGDNMKLLIDNKENEQLNIRISRYVL